MDIKIWMQNNPFVIEKKLLRGNPDPTNLGRFNIIKKPT